jgi:hypothetical protein
MTAIEACSCLRAILKLNEAGARAFCTRCKLFGLKQSNGSVTASREAIRRPVYVEHATEQELVADRRYRLHGRRQRT